MFHFPGVRLHGGSIRSSVLSVCPYVVSLHIMSAGYDISSSLFRGRFGVRYACGILLQGQHDFQRPPCSDINTNTTCIIPFPYQVSHDPLPIFSFVRLRSVIVLTFPPPEPSLTTFRWVRSALPPVPTAGQQHPEPHLDTRHQPSSITFCKPAQPRYSVARILRSI